MIAREPFNNGELFKFPESSEHLQWFQNLEDMRLTYAGLFSKLYGQNKDVKCFMVQVLRYKGSNRIAQKYSRKYLKSFEEVLVITCKVCSNSIVYGRIEAIPGYSLIFIRYYHLHTNNRFKYLNHLKLSTYIPTYLLKYQIDRQNKIIYRQRKDKRVNNSPLSEPTERISLHSEEKKIRKMFRDFDSKAIEYSYLPKTLFQSHSVQKDEQCPLHKRDSTNPYLPNILLICTPAMKEQYKRYGNLVGFDLTFGVISQRTSTDSQYLVGVFASTNLYKKIVIFGLVITNSQTILAYSFIFREFFKIMGKNPEVIITDEEKAIYFALKSLQDNGEFSGIHLLDMFHILKKFRECSTKTETFQLIRKLIHAKNRIEYRRLFKIAMRGIINEKELNTLRSFDLNSEKYSFSQIDPKYVGMSVSNSTNQFFHYLIKIQTPICTHYVKAIQQSLDLIEKRIFLSQFPQIGYNFMETINNSFLDRIYKIVSDKGFYFIFKQTTRSPCFRILSQTEVNSKNFIPNLKHSKEEEIPKEVNQIYLEQEGKYFLICFTLPTERSKEEEKEKKWFCLCQLQQKTGFFCSHLFKVLVYLKRQLLMNISERWKMVPEDLDDINLMRQIGPLKMNPTFQRKLFKVQDSSQNPNKARQSQGNKQDFLRLIHD